MVSKQNLSIWLAKVLDEYGYSEKRVQERIWMKDKNSLAKTISTREITTDKNIEKFMVGSQSEGISLWGESDSDWMQMNKAMLCTDKQRNIKGDKHGREVFRIDTKNAPNGYTFLQYKNHDNSYRLFPANLKHSLKKTPNGIYLSSAKFMENNEDVFHKSTGYIGRNTVYKERKGPSIPKQTKRSGFHDWVLKHCNLKINEEIDFVRCLECHYPALINSWVNRKRPYNWPPQEIMTKIAAKPIHVVPVGLASSKYEELQWRFSFTLAEISLVRSFNETQRKMLIILRQIAKYLLRPISPDISSYIIKNVTFWIIERTDCDMFRINQLLDRVLDGIDFLLECVDKRTLKHYFIPERNLFQGKLQGKQRNLIVEKLSYIKANSIQILRQILLSKDIEKDYPCLVVELRNQGFLNHLDKVVSLQSYPMTTSELANYFTYSYFCDFWVLIMFYGNVWAFLTFGTKLLSDPLSIDITEKLREPECHWYRCRVITRDKMNRKSLLKLEYCGWFLNMLFNISEKLKTCSRTKPFVLIFLYAMIFFI